MTIELTDPGPFDLLAVKGADAARFLQGQLSCNMDDLSETVSLPGAYCNLKGRVVADFLAIRDGDTILLRCETGMATLLRERLEKFAVFFKVTLSVVTDEWQRYGAIGEQAVNDIEQLTGRSAPDPDWSTLSTDRIIAIRIPGSCPRHEILVRPERRLENVSVSPADDSWRLEDIRSGIVHTGPGRVESYTPQVLNYDINGFINFRKGCYTGQEVVARMYYRSQAKKRLYHLTTSDAADPAAVQAMRNEGARVVRPQAPEHDAGEILEWAPSANGIELLAILLRDTAETAIQDGPGSLCLTFRSDGYEPLPLRINPLADDHDRLQRR